MTSWLDTPLEGLELIEYTLARLGDHWESRNGALVGHMSTSGERPQVTEPNSYPPNHRKRKAKS